jgi:homoserine dehydrogenase
VQQAVRDGCRVKLLASLRSRDDSGAGEPLAAADPPPKDARLEARVEPVVIPLADRLARVDGVTNALTIHTDAVDEVSVIGPGAGPEQAGQGVFSDLLAVVRAT